MGSPALEATLCDPKSSRSFKGGERRGKKNKCTPQKYQNRRKNSHTTTAPSPKGMEKKKSNEYSMTFSLSGISKHLT